MGESKLQVFFRIAIVQLVEGRVSDRYARIVNGPASLGPNPPEPENYSNLKPKSCPPQKNES